MPRKTIQHEIVTEEKLSKVCRENKELLEEFKEYLQSTNKSDLTIINYESDIQIFFVWLMEKRKNKEFTEITKRDVMKYQNYLLNDLKLSPNRIRRLKSAISSMSNFIENILDEDYPEFRNIINKIPAPTKEAVREKTVLSDEQIDWLLKELVDKKQYQRACVLALGACSGSRKSELLRFKVSYFKDEYIKFGSLFKTPEKIKTKGRNKGKLLYKWTLANEFKPYLDLWLKEREKLGIDNEYLFVTKQKGQWVQMPVSTLNSWAKIFSVMLNEDFYFHSLRHYFCTHLVNNNIPNNIIKDIIGWENALMIDIYNDNEVDDELGKYFDEGGIKEVKQGTLTEL